MRRLMCLTLGICGSLSVAAQITPDTLEGVEVRSGSTGAVGDKIRFQPGSKVVGIDSAILAQYQQQSIATLLSQATSVFVKSYGFNSLATLSFRGASAAQSAVYWEGVPLMNGSTGVSDLSLLPVSFADSVSIQYGAGGAMGGSGNVGGALMLQSRQPVFGRHRLHGGVQAGWGSYGQLPVSAEGGYSGSRLYLRGRVVATSATNDFSARDEAGRSFKTENAQLAGGGVMLEAAYRVNADNLISVHAWRQTYRRNIPRALFEAYSVKTQTDDAARFLLDWRHNGRRSRIWGKAAFIREAFAYQDSAISLSTGAVTHQYFGEWGIQGKAGRNISWLLFSPVQYLRLVHSTDGQQVRVAAGGSLRKTAFADKLDVSINGRVESFDGKIIGMPGAGLSYVISSALKLRASAQRSYRAPSLNELYYFPGGNRDLKPERGWGADGGYTFSRQVITGIHLTHSVSAYNRLVKDWIIWLGGAIWTPHNLAAVHSRGLETENTLSGKSGAVHWSASVMAAFTRSTNKESYLTNDNSIGRQIPYAPFFTGSATAVAGWKGASVTYVQQYVGKRYIVSDESAALRPYATGNLMMSYGMVRNGLRLTIRATIQNIWNSDYDVIAYRPMPGTNFLFGIGGSKD